MTHIEASEAAAKLGLRFDGAQDPCGLARATGSKGHERLAFTCIRKGRAEGLTIYLPLDATVGDLVQRWAEKLCEVLGHESKPAMAVTAALGEAIKELGSVPSGKLYAFAMPHMSLETYNSAVSLLKTAGLVKEEHHLLTWIGPKKS